MVNTYSECLEPLEDAIKKLNNMNISTARVGGLLSEIWVASELEKLGLKPRLGNNRKDKKADIYLDEINKRVEVKYAKPHYFHGIKAWGFNFGNGSQIKEEKFDFCVLVIADDCGIPKEAYILALKELKDGDNIKLGLRKDGKEHYDIHICENLKDYEEYMNKWGFKKTDLEIEKFN
ncbi:MAG: hypothetical protein QW303_02370 [Nitrososphaerota archaeon]